MATKRIEITTTRITKIEVDDDNEIVQDYKDEDEMIDHLVSYQFDSVLPVIHTGGVKVIDEWLEEYESKEV